MRADIMNRAINYAKENPGKALRDTALALAIWATQTWCGAAIDTYANDPTIWWWSASKMISWTNKNWTKVVVNVGYGDEKSQIDGTANLRLQYHGITGKEQNGVYRQKINEGSFWINSNIAPRITGKYTDRTIGTTKWVKTETQHILWCDATLEVVNCGYTRNIYKTVKPSGNRVNNR